ncbi:MAG: sugar phosphate isomerase/epimerase family protein [Novosphingobium sp.]
MDALEIGLCWGTVYKASLIEMIEAAARYGFPTISFPPALLFDAIEAGHNAAGLRRRLADAGTRVRVVDCISGGLPGMPSSPISFDGRTMPRPDEKACFAMAEMLDAPIVNLAHYGADPVPREELVEAIAGICRRASVRGLTIALEFVPETGIPSLEGARAIAGATGESNCTILLDTWHLARTGGTATHITALPTGSIGAFQLCDRTEPPAGTPYVPMTGRDLPGEGQLPLHEIVTAARANNPAITAEIEVFSEELAGMSIDKAAARTAAALAAWRAANGI